MKEIWINLELYFKSYEFSKFQGFFWINFTIFNVKNNIKISKKGGVYSRGAMWMRRGTQGHVAAPHGPTRHLRGADVTYLYLL